MCFQPHFVFGRDIVQRPVTSLMLVFCHYYLGIELFFVQVFQATTVQENVGWAPPWWRNGTWVSLSVLSGWGYQQAIFFAYHVAVTRELSAP